MCVGLGKDEREMNSAFCTYCSADKSEESGNVPAIRRYLSSRIDRIYSAATELGLPFFILSGKYGLIPPERPIPWYDHLLTPGEVPAMSDVVAQQMHRLGIASIVYFSKVISGNDDLFPYCAVFLTACTLASVNHFVVELNPGVQEEGVTDWRTVMKAAESAKRQLMADRLRGELEFERLLNQHPGDAMIWFKRGEAYESIGCNELAAPDYQRAVNLFPMPKWKAIAREALDGVRRR